MSSLKQDHVEAFEANDVNVLVVDTEMYSNTGGQQSKATPAGASVKFAVGGKVQRKKNIGEIFMTYEHVYVASVSLHNQSQSLQAFVEADRHKGPSLIVAYSPCIQQGVRPRGLNDMFDECKLAVDSGYWPLYRYNPALIEEGSNPFILDSKRLRKDVVNFLQRESRFINLEKKHPKIAEALFVQANKDVHHRMELLLKRAAGYKAFDQPENATVRVLFASETGTAAQIARDFASACVFSHTADALDDVELDDIDGMTNFFFIATCGQGAMPQNGRQFYKNLVARTTPFREGTKFTVFGLGDSSYYFFCKAAKDIESHMEKLGALKILDLGLGDDSAEDGLDEGLHEWLDRTWPAMGLSPPAEIPHITPLKVVFSDRAIMSTDDDQKAVAAFFQSDFNKAVRTEIQSNTPMCRPDYDRNFRTITFEKKNMDYHLGDCLEIFPHNEPEMVSHFLHSYSQDFGESTVVRIHEFGIDGEVSLQALFTFVLDLFGKPSKHFMHQLASFETDEEERKAMLDPGFLRKSAKESGATVADILLRFRKSQPPLPALLAMIPTIKPRAYSITSAPLASKSTIELLVLIETWWCNEGIRVGLTCNMLQNLKSGDHVWCRIKTGSMEPPSPTQSAICVGIGSGLAPHIAFLRDRVRAAKEGEAVGLFSLYFGNRVKADEYLHQAELEEYKAKYDWLQLHLAFSRDDPNHKVYVQDLVARTDDAWRLLCQDPDGLLYICGNRNLPKPLQEALIQSYAKSGNVSKQMASAQVERLFVEGRAQQEVW